MVSVITPCYNAESTIAQTIESVLNQTYKDWEMLIVDDSSTDRSPEIIKKYIERDKRIKYFKTDKPSGSPSLPRNIGIENASGEYIAFLDADDIWLPQKLEIQVKFMIEKKVDLSYSFYEKISHDGVRNNRIIKTSKLTTYNSLLHSNTIPCLTGMISREAIGNIRFKQIPQEDFCFWLDVLKKGYQAHNLCKVTSLYRESKNARSSNKLDMFKGYWNVIRNHQNISFISASFDMLTYTVLGLKKYLV